MSWDRIILETAVVNADLRPMVDRLFAQQRQTFPTFRAGEAALGEVRTKELEMDGARVIVQVNPGRKRSTYAKVDAASVAERPCFLCPGNIPAEERGIAHGELVLLPNPYPILRHHCTVALREHVPQRIGGRVRLLLELSRALGPDMLAFYNGPRAGASAPDHFHFQACESAAPPLLGELTLDGSVAQSTFGRRCLVFVDAELDGARLRVESALGVLEALGGGESSDDPNDAEPMVNIVALYRDDRFMTVLFPRARHRPSCFDGEGEARIAVSPGALEMAGIMVVADPEHFDRLDAAAAAGIYREVSIAPERFARLAEEVT